MSQPTTSEPAIASDLIDRLRARFEGNSVQQFLRFHLADLALDRCSMTVEFRPDFNNGGGAIHGGILAALADTAVACALSTNFNGKMGFATSNLNIHFLRRARSAVTAEARIIKKGNRVCVGQVEMHDAEGKLVATCTTDFILTTSKFEEPEP